MKRANRSLFNKRERVEANVKPIPLKDEIKIHRNLVQQHRNSVREIRLQNSLEKLKSKGIVE